MAKNELLCLLVSVLLIVILSIFSCKWVFAANDDFESIPNFKGVAATQNFEELQKLKEGNKSWAIKLGEQQREEFLSKIRNQAAQYFGEEKGEEMLKPRPDLQIFVSGSMSKALLKDYAREASIYGGVLVFRGLPDGSMLKLLKLVSDISEENYSAAMQIDDQSFENYAIDVVPAIVLSQGEDFGIISNKIPGHDKMSGNISIEYALECFAKDGDLADKASELLEKRKQGGKHEYQ
jgi:type-F conjugative transfer system pilin assembly protein TrbC